MGGRFFASEGAWFKLESLRTRKVSSLLRDMLHTQYRSSAKAKIIRRSSGKRDTNSTRSAAGRRWRPHSEDDSSMTSSRWGEAWISRDRVFNGRRALLLEIYPD
jgi:hypothetical protein